MVDYVKITVKAGNGGDGLAHLLREKFRSKGGPDGGDGGNGGDVYLLVDDDLNTLAEFRYKREFEAENGRKGQRNKKFGAGGEDLVIKVPRGTVVKKNGEVVADLSEKGEKIKVARGGKGGNGNWHFRSSTNQTPTEYEEGGKGEKFELELELKVLADVGLVGLPNVGKSTLLAVLTRATPKIANYPFTTLEANLGVLEIGKKRDWRSVVIADIPGLIEGASEGKGLGQQFLRHVERTRVVVHVLAIDGGEEGWSMDESVVEKLKRDYEVVRKEMKEYGQGLANKKELVVVNKVELLNEGDKERLVKEFENALFVSGETGEGMEELKKKIVGMVE